MFSVIDKNADQPLLKIHHSCSLANKNSHFVCLKRKYLKEPIIRWCRLRWSDVII